MNYRNYWQFEIPQGTPCLVCGKAGCSPRAAKEWVIDVFHRVAIELLVPMQVCSFITAGAKQDRSRYLWFWNKNSWVLPTKPHLQRVVWLATVDSDLYATLWTLLIECLYERLTLRPLLIRGDFR